MDLDLAALRHKQIKLSSNSGAVPYAFENRRLCDDIRRCPADWQERFWPFLIADPAMMKFLPAGFLGLMVGAFIAAHSSTITTLLNWESSYRVHDFYQRFVWRGATEKHYVLAARLATVGLFVVGCLMTTVLDSARQICWVATAYLGPRTDDRTLIAFYGRVRPAGPGWTRIRQAAGIEFTWSSSGLPRRDGAGGTLWARGRRAGGKPASGRGRT